MGSRLGLFGRLPMMMGGGKPRGQSLYEMMRDSRGTGRYSQDVNADVNVDLRAMAWQIEGAASAQERASNNGFPILATDFLPDWERGLGRSPDPSETPGQRRDTLESILAGNGEPTGANILDALGKALPGATITLTIPTARVFTYGAPIVLVPSPVLTDGGAGSGILFAGTHYVAWAFESAAGLMTPTNVLSVALPSSNRGVVFGTIPLSTVAGSVRVHLYLSVAPYSTLLAEVADNVGGSTLVSRYPVTPDVLPLHHYGIFVAKTVYDDAVARSKIDAVLGPMLPSHCTYDVIIGSPFVLGTTTGSELGRGGL